jgi:hypothetical protein
MYTILCYQVGTQQDETDASRELISSPKFKCIKFTLCDKYSSWDSPTHGKHPLRQVRKVEGEAKVRQSENAMCNKTLKVTYSPIRQERKVEGEAKVRERPK